MSTSKSIIGRLALRSYQEGDELPEVGETVLVSGPHNDVESDQHRSYAWRKVIGYANGGQFIVLQTGDCWPTVERTEFCWFADEDALVKNAAHDLLAACKVAFDQTCSVGRPKDWKQLRAAIAKAEGTAP